MPGKSRKSKLGNLTVGVVVILVLVVSWFSLPNSKRVTPKPYVEFVATVQDPRCFFDNGADTTQPFWFGFCTGYNLGSALAGNNWSAPGIDDDLLNIGEPSATKDFYRNVCYAIDFVNFNDSGREFTDVEVSESKKACQDGMNRGYKKELTRLIRDNAPNAYLGVNPPRKIDENAPTRKPVKPQVSPTKESSSGGMRQKCTTVQVPNPNYNGRLESDANGNIILPFFPERRCAWVPN
jgi:hypothetical protein